MSLKYNKDNFNGIIKLSTGTLQEISWGKNTFTMVKAARYPKIGIRISTE